MIKTSSTYKEAGVDINAAHQLVNFIKHKSSSTRQTGVVSGIGGFGALFALPWQEYHEPILVSGTDGVGTKLKLAIEFQQHDTIGIDLVAMCVNDVITSGAKPLFFLDYFATGKLHLEQAKHIMSGVIEGCRLADAALIGGETAEMPGLYHNEDYDLAGFCVGIVEKSKIIDGSQIAADDVLIALASSGPHANGYSLIRYILQNFKIDVNTKINDVSLKNILLTPTKIYAKTLEHLLKNINIKGIAHITGGGLIENVPRMLPEKTCAVIETKTWQIPEIFTWLQTQGQVDSHEMFKTFNMGIGMVLCVNKKDVAATLQLLSSFNETAWVTGYITNDPQNQQKIRIT